VPSWKRWGNDKGIFGEASSIHFIARRSAGFPLGFFSNGNCVFETWLGRLIDGWMKYLNVQQWFRVWQRDVDASTS
jgi:hypothetical protein